MELERGNEATVKWVRSVGAVLILMGMIVSAQTTQAQSNAAEADRIVGTWLTAEGKAHIEVYASAEGYCGKIVWLKEPDENGKPKVDNKNPIDSLRGQPILGLRMMYGFAYDEDDEWTGGKAYDPESGSTYSAKLRLKENDTMELRGYILVPLFGRTETWQRIRSGL